MTINQKLIKEIDKSNMKLSIESFPNQINEMIKNYDSYGLKNEYSKIQNVIILGMGGSAIGAEICNTIIKNDNTIPILINRNYNIPGWLSKNTLVIASSYSGNTEETIMGYEKACKKTKNIIVISTGGILSDIAKKNNHDIIKIPKDYQPRAAIGYSMMAIFFSLIKTKLISYKFIDVLKLTISSLKKYSSKLSNCNNDNEALIWAKILVNKIPVIYGSSDTTEIVALRFKGQLQENSKMIAFHNILPEMNHNEIEGWYNNENFIVLWLEDKDDLIQNKNRIIHSKKILENLDIINKCIEVSGNNFVERFLKFIILTDWISFYLAILNKVDPSPVRKIQKLKKLLIKNETS